MEEYEQRLHNFVITEKSLILVFSQNSSEQMVEKGLVQFDMHNLRQAQVLIL